MPRPVPLRKLRRAWRVARGAEYPATCPDRDHFRRSIVQLCGRCSIPEAAELIRLASLLVGIDRGPSHLANAAGTPGLILPGLDRRRHEDTPDAGRHSGPSSMTLLRHDGPAGEPPAGACIEASDEMIGSRGGRGPAETSPKASREEEHCP